MLINFILKKEHKNETIETQNTEIAALKKEIEGKNASLAEFDTKVKTLNTNIQQQSDTINYKQKVICGSGVAEW